MTTESVRYIQLDRLVLVGDDTSFIRVIGRQPELEVALLQIGARMAGFSRGYAVRLAEQHRASSWEPVDQPPIRSLEQLQRGEPLPQEAHAWFRGRPKVNLKPAQEEV